MAEDKKKKNTPKPGQVVEKRKSESRANWYRVKVTRTTEFVIPPASPKPTDDKSD